MRSAKNAQFHVLIVDIRWPVETFIERLIKGLLEHDIAITVATAEKPSEEWLKTSGFYWLFTPNWDGLILIRLLRLLKMFGKSFLLAKQDIDLFRHHFENKSDFVKQLRKWNQLMPFTGGKWDVIYFPWNPGAIKYLPLFDLEKPVVISCRGSSINVAPHNLKEVSIIDGLLETFKRSTKDHCVSEAIKNEAVNYGLAPEKAVVIPPAVDPDFFKLDKKLRVENLEQRGYLWVVSIGSLIWRKGYEYALLVIRKCLDMGIPIQYSIIGDGLEKQRVLDTIYDLGLNDNVKLLGKLSPDQIVNELNRNDVFLFTSLSEGIPNALLEAMSCAIPVVTTDCGGVSEAVTNGVEGFVTDLRDVNDLASKIRKLYEHPELRHEMGTNGRERIIKDYNQKDQIRKFVDMFESVLSKEV